MEKLFKISSEKQRPYKNRLRWAKRQTFVFNFIVKPITKKRDISSGIFSRMADVTYFLPNNSYPLPGETFRLYYTSASTDQQKIDVYIEDSFGQVEQLTFSFNNENDKEPVDE